MALSLPTAAQAAAQTPLNTFSPTSNPIQNLTNGLTYVYDPALGVWSVSSPGGTAVSSFSGGTTGLTPAGAATGPVTLGGILGVANGGTGQSTALIPSGTTMLFAQAAAPTGWTQVTTQNDKALRVVSGAGGGSGGTVPFSTLFSTTSSYTGSMTITSGQVGSTTLSVSQLASHDHPYVDLYAAVQQGRNGGTDFVGLNSTNSITSPTGGDATHTHTLVGAVTSGNFTSNFNVTYVDVIICSKN